MTDRYSHAIVTCHEKPTEKNQQALRMVRNVAKVVPLGEEVGVLVIFDREIRSDDFEAYENAISALSFVEKVVGKVDGYGFGATATDFRVSIEKSVMALEPSLDSAAPREIEEYVKAFRVWKTMAAEIIENLWKREH